MPSPVVYPTCFLNIVSNSRTTVSNSAIRPRLLVDHDLGLDNVHIAQINSKRCKIVRRSSERCHSSRNLFSRLLLIGGQNTGSNMEDFIVWWVLRILTSPCGRLRPVASSLSGSGSESAVLGMPTVSTLQTVLSLSAISGF